MVTKSNVVPIAYNAGTGGNFLAYILDSALIGRPTNESVKFSRYGNAHLLQRYFIPWVGLASSVDVHVAEYLSYDKNKDRVEIESSRSTMPSDWIFLAYHLIYLKEIMFYAKKGILINYDYDDIDEILKVVIGKTCLDGCYVPNGDYWYIPKEDLYSLAFMYNKHYMCLTGYHSNFQPMHDFGDNVLNISWKEFMYENVDTFVDKLSKFTELEVSKFNIDAINEWRRLTRFCIEDIEPLKQQILTVDNLPGMPFWRVKND